MSDAPTAADLEVARAWEANLAALAATQPSLCPAVRDIAIDLTWVYGRDGALSAMHPSQQWWGGCSVPRLAAEAMLKTFDPRGQVACFLSPNLAAQIRVVLDMMQDTQAVIAVVPAIQTLAVMLHCADFTTDIRSHRLFLAAGEQWLAELERIFAAHPGLSIPSQFIRLPTLRDEAVHRLIESAQEVFAAQTAGRNQRLEELCAASVPRGSRRVCVVAGSHFRLWNDTGHALKQALHDVEHTAVDIDDPLHQSPLATALAARECAAIACPDLFRSDLPRIVPDGTIWITWMTTPRLPPPPRGRNDRLLLADPAWSERALAAGWAPDHLFPAPWGRGLGADDSPVKSSLPGASSPQLCILADTQPIAPTHRTTYSSHQLLWQRIAEELHHDPFIVGDNPDAFLTDRMRQMDISMEGLDRVAFLNRLIQPAYEQGIARILIQGGLPLRLWGKGWDAIPDFRPYSAGVILSRDHFHKVARSATVLVHVWPTVHCHPIDSLDRTVLRRAGRRREGFLREARALLAAPPPSVAVEGSLHDAVAAILHSL